MPPQTDTYARAFACCADILAELGRFPTIDLVRGRIGVNSPATIKRAINDWTLQFAEQYIENQQATDVPAVLVDGLRQVWRTAVAEADKAFLQKEQAHLDRVKQLEAAWAEEQQLTQALGDQLDEARRELERQGELARHLDSQLAEAVQQNLAAVDALEASQVENERLAGRLADEQIRHTRQQEQDQAWFARRLVEEKDFLEAKHRDEADRLKRQLAALKESEATLQQLCAGLRRDLLRAEAELAKTRTQASKADAHKFRLKGRDGKRPGPR